MSTRDPIQEKYYRPLNVAEHWADVAFWLAAAFSFAALLVEKTNNEAFYNLVQGCFVLLVIAAFFAGQVIKLYFYPRAEEKRRQEFLSQAFGVALTHEQTRGYYNNDCPPGTIRMAAQVLENSLFSKNIAREMARHIRLLTGGYVCIWIVAVLNRNTDLAFAATAAQALFSEQLLSRLLRIEWLRMRFEKSYDESYKLFQTGSYGANFSAVALEIFTCYESAKTTAGITLSSRIFSRLNGPLSSEWDEIKRVLRIAGT